MVSLHCMLIACNDESTIQAYNALFEVYPEYVNNPDVDCSPKEPSADLRVRNSLNKSKYPQMNANKHRYKTIYCLTRSSDTAWLNEVNKPIKRQSEFVM